MQIEAAGTKRTLSFPLCKQLAWNPSKARLVLLHELPLATRVIHEPVARHDEMRHFTAHRATPHRICWEVGPRSPSPRTFNADAVGAPSLDSESLPLLYDVVKAHDAFEPSAESSLC